MCIYPRFSVIFYIRNIYNMKRPSRSEDGAYHINGKKYNELFGSRQQVWNGTAYKTAGELTKKALMMNKWGRIVSSKKHKTAKKEKRLQKYGYFAEKGKFGYVKKNGTKKARTMKKGGNAECDIEMPCPPGKHCENEKCVNDLMNTHKVLPDNANNENAVENV